MKWRGLGSAEFASPSASFVLHAVERSSSAFAGRDDLAHGSS